jgi:hypothetical protein
VRLERPVGVCVCVCATENDDSYGARARLKVVAMLHYDVYGFAESVLRCGANLTDR